MTVFLQNILFDGSVLVYCVCPTKQSSFINIISIVLVVLKLTKRVLCETRNASVRLLKKHISMEANASAEIGVDLLLDSREKERERERHFKTRNETKLDLQKQLEQLFLPFFRKRSLTAKSFTHTRVHRIPKNGNLHTLNATSVIEIIHTHN